MRNHRSRGRQRCAGGLLSHEGSRLKPERSRTWVSSRIRWNIASPQSSWLQWGGIVDDTTEVEASGDEPIDLASSKIGRYHVPSEDVGVRQEPVQGSTSASRCLQIAGLPITNSRICPVHIVPLALLNISIITFIESCFILHLSSCVLLFWGRQPSPLRRKVSRFVNPIGAERLDSQVAISDTSL